MKDLLSKTDFAQKIADIQRAVKEREKAAQDEVMQERIHRENNNLVKLDLWANCQRGVPNSILRGSLFAATQNKNARYCEQELLHESDSIKVVYTGKRLTQTDLDVWECALHLARLQNLGNKVEITQYAFLKELGRKATKQEYNWLKKIFAKLCACCVEITHNNLTYGGNLIQSFYRDEKTGNSVLIVNSEIGRLYEGGRATWIQWEERQKIGKRKPLAQWLHGYISSHAKWYPHKVETLRNYSGSETKEVRKFKQNLSFALEYLLSLNLIQSFRVDENNLVHIERPPNKAQQKHLERKKGE